LHKGGGADGARIHVAALAVILVVLFAILAIDRNGDRQKQAQLLVSQIDSHLTLNQNVPWDADPEGAGIPPAQVRATLTAAGREIRADLLELGGIDPALLKLVPLAERNAEILLRQLPAVAAADEAETNELANEAAIVSLGLRRELNAAAERFSESASSAKRYTLLGTAGLLFLLYAAFALTLILLRRMQRQAATQSERLLQSQKMEAVGQLAGGIAHDFNNLLVGIRGFTELAQSSLDTESPAHADLCEATAAADRATLLTHQLLAFSRNQVLQRMVIDPNAAVSDVATLLDRLIGEKISIKVELDPEVPCIEADPGQLGQVIVNLAVNARDAMPAGGELTIRTSGSDIDTSVLGSAAGPWVVIEVSDTGLGMDAATQKRMFEPFFTTKDVGAGTGLGLATVWAIVAQSHGHIDVRSAVGTGTTIAIYLPASAKFLDTTKERANGTRATGAGITILLVDDNDPVRSFVARTLGALDYTVLTAANADEALTLATPGTGIDLLLTDLNMPGMSGHELAATLGHLPVLYMSGHPKESSPKVCDEEAHFIQKPFAMAELTDAVSAVLADRPARTAA
jgi:signal transduction histidine kinase